MLEGYELWVPPTPPTYAGDGMPYYEIVGTDAQIVQFPIRPGRKIMCFAGAMAYMSDGMKMECELSGLGKTFGRLSGGGSLFQLTYSNVSLKEGYIGMTPDYPGVIVPINMSTSGKVIALRDSFLCATVGMGNAMTDVSGGFNPTGSPMAFCCSGFDCTCVLVSSIANTNKKEKSEPNRTESKCTRCVLCLKDSSMGWIALAGCSFRFRAANSFFSRAFFRNLLFGATSEPVQFRVAEIHLAARKPKTNPGSLPFSLSSFPPLL